MNKLNNLSEEERNYGMMNNSVVRSVDLSLRAKGLYCLIASYARTSEEEITKNLLANQCKEGEKAFNSAWNELKISGYLKIHQYHVSKGGVRYEYELLTEPDNADGVYLYRHDKEGNIISTNKS